MLSEGLYARNVGKVISFVIPEFLGEDTQKKLKSKYETELSLQIILQPKIGKEINPFILVNKILYRFFSMP